MRTFSILLLLIFLVSCQSGVTYSEYVSLPNGWTKNEPVTFLIEENDTLAKKNLFIMLRNDEHYEFSNIYLIAKMEVPNSDKVIVDTLQYEMATPEGKWLGDGYSAVKESKLWYKEQFVFPAKGKYNIKIEQAMRKIGDNEGVPVLKGMKKLINKANQELKNSIIVLLRVIMKVSFSDCPPSGEWGFLMHRYTLAKLTTLIINDF